MSLDIKLFQGRKSVLFNDRKFHILARTEARRLFGRIGNENTHSKVVFQEESGILYGLNCEENILQKQGGRCNEVDDIGVYNSQGTCNVEFEDGNGRDREHEFCLSYDKVYLDLESYVKLMGNATDIREFLFKMEHEPSSFITKPEEGSKTMSTKDKATNAAAIAVEAQKQAAVIVASKKIGDGANALVTKAVVGKLPEGVAEYAGTEYGDMVIAALVSVGAAFFLPENEKAQAVSKAMVLSAQMNLADLFDIKELIEDLFEGLDSKALTTLIDSDKEAS